MMQLPIADPATVRRRSLAILAGYRGQLVRVVTLQALAAIAALAVPYLLGILVDAVSEGTTVSVIDRVGIGLLVAVLAQAVLIRYAHRYAMILGEEIFAELREEFLAAVTHLPLSTVEKAGTGDLIGRTTNDVDRVQWMIRFGVPRVLVLVATILLTVVAAVIASPLTAIAVVVGIPIIVFVVRRYLRKANPAYLRNSQAWAAMNGTLTESVEQARATDTLALGPRRRRRTDEVLAEAWDTEVVTLRMRVTLFFWFGISFMLPVAVALVWGAWLINAELTTLGAVTTVALYLMQVRPSVGELMFWVDEAQVALASLARIFGVSLVEPDREVSGEEPATEDVEAHDVRFAYREGVEVLKGIDLDLIPGERLAVVGPSGAGKSTLGRMLAGIHPPTGGAVTVGGVPLVDLAEEDLRSHVALVTQEHHVFVGTVADNLRLALKDETRDPATETAILRDALAAVDALEWVDALPEGMDTAIGSGARELTPGQAQQIALARLVLLDPHTLILDEATSLIDPRAARHLERSLSAVLDGRTVLAIAHRLHTAHDADRVAVVDGGHIVELGSHDELVAAGGEYASLWESWQQT